MKALPSKYKVGDDIEVWSNSHKRWSRGKVDKIEGSKASVKYESPDGQIMMKQMPESHEHLRHTVSASGAPADNAQEGTSSGIYKAGDQVEIWSNSQKTWCRGSIEKLQGDLVNVKYVSPDGQTMTKLMPNGHECLRHREQQTVPPPPPPPGRSSQDVNEAPPPPLAESACREDTAEMRRYIEACETNLGGSNAMASQKLGGTPMASHNAMGSRSASQAKGHRAADPMNTHPYMGAQQDNEVFVAESTSWSPSGGMVLCGMPMKAKKKPEVVLNDDGTPVARCPDTDRCCRCSMPVGSYFDHTCPRCLGVVCLNCLDDLKFIIATYRCPHCGDQQYNEEALKQTLWYLKVYRNAQRAVGAVPILLAGLFGYGPEGKGTRTAKQTFSAPEEETPVPEVPAVKAPPPRAAEGPPPPPPKPKPKGQAANQGQDVPEYHTRPPPGWAEGAGTWRPGQAGGSPPNPSKVAAAMHQAAAGQASGSKKPVDPTASSRGANPFGSTQNEFQTRVPPATASPMR
jgi:hypothetical protein